MLNNTFNAVGGPMQHTEATDYLSLGLKIKIHWSMKVNGRLGKGQMVWYDYTMSEPSWLSQQKCIK